MAYDLETDDCRVKVQHAVTEANRIGSDLARIAGSNTTLFDMLVETVLEEQNEAFGLAYHDFKPWTAMQSALNAYRPSKAEAA